MVELTEKHLNIPYAVASIYKQKDTEEFEELVSVGFLALVEAAHKYDPKAVEGPSHFGAFAYQRVQWKVIRESGVQKYSSSGRWKRLARLEYVVSSNGMKVVDLLEDTKVESPDASLETGDFIERALRRLCPIDRATFVLHATQETTVKEIAKHLKVSESAIYERLERSRRKLRLYIKTLGRFWRCGNAEGRIPPHTERQRKFSADHCIQREKERRLMGYIPTRFTVWYFAEDDAKLLHGPEKGLTELYAMKGIPIKVQRGRRKQDLPILDGLRPIRGNDARSLVAKGYKLKDIFYGLEGRNGKSAA